MPIHTVKQGEQLSSIAAQYGFSDYKLIWNDSNNAKLREKRDPHVLFPGDQVFVPQKVLKNEDGVTTKIHIFEVKEVPLFLRVRVRDIDEKPIDNALYKLDLDSKQDPNRSGSTNAEAILTEKIQPTLVDAKLAVTVTLPSAEKDVDFEIDEVKYDLKVGFLNPKTTFSGQQARLNNLGYFAGFASEETDQLRWAIEEFQCDHMGMKPVKKVPVIVPESEDPAAITGVQDQPTVDAIEKEHGI
jgi:hypothetical protein